MIVPPEKAAKNLAYGSDTNQTAARAACERGCSSFMLFGLANLAQLAARVVGAQGLEVVDVGCDFVHPGCHAQPVVSPAFDALQRIMDAMAPLP